MDRNIFRDDHDQFRRSFRRFIDLEVKPHQEKWAAAGVVDRETWRKAGHAGFLCPWLEPEKGGAGGDLQVRGLEGLTLQDAISALRALG